MIKSFISDKVEIRDSKTNGVGSFAKVKILKDEIVCIKGGHILTRDTMFSYEKIDGYWPIDDNIVIAALNEEEFKSVKLYVNHSCSPNCGIRGEITVIAMRDIFQDEEITFDYAMLDNEDNSFVCNCGSPNCRRTITGFDWKNEFLQKKYHKYFATYLKIKFSL